MRPYIPKFREADDSRRRDPASRQADLDSEFRRVDENVSAAMQPYGLIEWFAGGIESVPEAFYVCDGRAVSRNDNKRLFALLGTRYGDGDGETTFNLPNLRGMIPVGATAGQFAGQTELLELKDDQGVEISLFRLIPVIRKG